MDDYCGFARLFSRLAAKFGKIRETIIFTGHWRGPHPVAAGQGSPILARCSRRAGKDRASCWPVGSSKDNQYFFAKPVNIVWAHLLRQGIIDPVDDVAQHPAVNPELLERPGPDPDLQVSHSSVSAVTSATRTLPLAHPKQRAK